MIFDKLVCPVCEKPTRKIGFYQSLYKNSYKDYYKYICSGKLVHNDGQFLTPEHYYQFDYLGNIDIQYLNYRICNETSMVYNKVFYKNREVLRIKGMIPAFATEDLLEQYVKNYNLLK